MHQYKTGTLAVKKSQQNGASCRLPQREIDLVTMRTS